MNVAIGTNTNERNEQCNPMPPGTGIGSHSSRLDDQVLPILAHELRQPLSAILLALGTEQLECSDKTAAREARDIAHHEALHMSQIISDLLDVCSDKRGRPHLHLEPVDLAVIVHRSIATSRASLDAGGHRLSVSLPPDPVSLMADPSRLEQILTNLLTNSAKYTGPGGHIYVSADVCSDVVVIRVRDNGRGISPDLLARIFDLYQRGNHPEERGLGLGLALVKSLVELHGGSVAAYSQGLGMGSEFVVRLPVSRKMETVADGKRDEELPWPDIGAIGNEEFLTAF
ncbi:MAG: HAMP domain-containing sensor histidine kinase [Tepidisphaeraceae bacterium]